MYKKNITDISRIVEELRKEARKPVTEQKKIFKLIRMALGLTQHELALKLDVQLKTVSRWELGKHVPNLTYKQFLTLSHELKRLGVDFLGLACYKVIMTPYDIQNVQMWYINS